MAQTIDPRQSSWLRLACQRSVVARALKVAVVVGPLLVAINHGDALLRGEITNGRVCRIFLTLLVPYGVATCASVGTARDTSAAQMTFPGGRDVDRKHSPR